MKLVVITQPEPLLTSQDDTVRQALRLDGSDNDANTDLYLLAAQAELDGPLGKLGFSVAQQTVELRVDKFCDRIYLPGGPIIDGSTSISYLENVAGVETDLSSGFVQLSDGTIERLTGSSWPAIYLQSEAVRITYDVGITDEADPRVRQMKTAIILHAKMSMNVGGDDDGPNRRKAFEELVHSLRAKVL